MKKEKKLALRKVTVSNLLEDQMKVIQGGNTFTGDWTTVAPATGSVEKWCKFTAEQSCATGVFHHC